MPRFCGLEAAGSDSKLYVRQKLGEVEVARGARFGANVAPSRDWKLDVGVGMTAFVHRRRFRRLVPRNLGESSIPMIRTKKMKDIFFQRSHRRLERW